MNASHNAAPLPQPARANPTPPLGVKLLAPPTPAQLTGIGELITRLETARHPRLALLAKLAEIEGQRAALEAQIQERQSTLDPVDAKGRREIATLLADRGILDDALARGGEPANPSREELAAAQEALPIVSRAMEAEREARIAFVAAALRPWVFGASQARELASSLPGVANPSFVARSASGGDAERILQILTALARGEDPAPFRSETT